MPEAVPIVLWSWVPVTLLLFWKLPARVAAAAGLVVGWLLLPTARFADDVAGVAFPYWIMPACLPSDYWTTKARVIGIALLLGVMAFDPGAWRRFRPSFYDLPMLGWCLIPLPSGLRPNGRRCSRPRLAGRLGLSRPGLGRALPDRPALLRRPEPGSTMLAGGRRRRPGLRPVLPGRERGRAGALSKRCSTGSTLTRTDGAVRYLGYRPIVFLEHGNQLGTWMASSAMTAAWLWRSGQLSRFWGMPGWLVVSVLVVASRPSRNRPVRSSSWSRGWPGSTMESYRSSTAAG